jgi:nicotinamidase/pyrazinamidase
MKQRALLLVDLQNDFCAGGALVCGRRQHRCGEHADRLVPGTRRTCTQDRIRLTTAVSPVIRLRPQGVLDGLAQTFWPDHCVQHSEGAALHPLKASAIDAVFHKGQTRLSTATALFLINGKSAKTDFILYYPTQPTNAGTKNAQNWAKIND